MDDEDIEEEFKKLEFEVGGEDPHAHTAAEETEASTSIESLSDAVSKIELADKPSRTSVIKDASVRKNLERLELESA